MMNKALAKRRPVSRMRSRVVVAVVAALSVLALVLAGCGSGGEARSDSAAVANVAEAESFVEEWMDRPTTYHLPPMKEAPPRGKKIALVYNNVSQPLVDGAEEAAEELGWTTVPIVFDPSKPRGLQDAFQQALEINPDGVLTSGTERSEYAAVAKKLAENNIPVVTNSSDDPIEPPIVANTNDPDQVRLAARITANYVIAEKGADANVALFNVPSISVLAVYTEQFEKEYHRLCPGCTYQSINVQSSDIGSTVPTQVVSTVQNDPEINFAVMGFGGMTTGISGALRTAGYSDVKIVGNAPLRVNVGNLLSGAENMWVGLTSYGLSWKGMDALARHFNGEEIPEVEQALQILTKETAPDPAALSEIENYREYFRQLWHIG